MQDNVHYQPLTAVARLIEAGELSPVELTGYMLDRIEAVDGRLKSYATVTADRAMDAARRAEREIRAGHYRGPLHGMPIAVKDLCYTEGIRTMGGLRVHKDLVPDHNATVVNLLDAAGAVLLGKLNLTEGALSAYHPDFDIPVNPWAPQLWAGVSSSGSGVATAAGLCFGSLGTDTGGSIRYPSMANGIVGLKPTYGRVSRFGVMELAGSLDHVGPMTRSVADAAVMLEAIAGHDDKDSTSLTDTVPTITAALDSTIEGLSLGIDESYIADGTNPGLLSTIEQVIAVLRRLGVKTVPISIPRADPVELRNLWLPITGYEAARAHADTFPARAGDYGGYLRSVLELGLNMSAADYAEVMEKRTAFSREFETELNKVDAVICPAGGFVFEADRQAQYGDAVAMKDIIRHFQGQFTIPADLAGTPSLTLPCGVSEDGRPYAVQLLGSKLAEPTLCRLGHAYEQATEWHRRHPEH